MPHLPKSFHQPLSHINKTLTTPAGDEQLHQEHDLNSRRPLSLSLTYISLLIHLLFFPDLTQSSSAGFNGGNKWAKEERACRSVKNSTIFLRVDLQFCQSTTTIFLILLWSCLCSTRLLQLLLSLQSNCTTVMNYTCVCF
jgi:hypothetical protein